MFYIAAITLSFFLAFILFTKRDKTRSDKVLGVWLIVIGTHLTSYYLNMGAPVYYRPYLLLTYPFPLLHGPFLYLYTMALTQQSFLFKRQYLLHFIPFLLFYVLMLPFFMKTPTEQLIVFDKRGEGYEWLMLLHKVMVFASGVVYIILSLIRLKKHRQLLRANFSEVEKINLIWLRYLAYEMVLVWLAVFYGDDRIIFTLVAVFVLFLGYFGIKQVGIFTQKTNLMIVEPLPAEPKKTTVIIPETPEPKVKYLKSALTPDMQTTIHHQLIQIMEVQNAYLNPDLTLAELAKLLDVHPNHLSQVINSAEGKSFYDFVNRKRVEAFKKRALLPESQKYTITALAYECGFNSKTAFYRNFKNLTGQSPSDYLKQHQVSIKS